jgi:hypothetical protein
VGPAFGAFDEELTALTNDTTYFYRCRVENSAGGAWAESSGQFTTGTVPSTLVSIANFGDIAESKTWQGFPPVPTSGTSDAATWRVVNSVDRGAPDESVSFAGQTLLVGDGVSDAGRLRLEDGNGTLTVRDLVLNSNGVLWQDRDSNTLAGETLSLQGGQIAAERNGRMNLRFASYDGSGTVYFFGNNANSDPNVVFQTSSAIAEKAMLGFTGTLHRDRLNGAGGSIAFDFDIPVATFAIVLADTDADLPPDQDNEGASDTPGHNGKLRLNDGVDISVTGLHLFDQASDGTTVTDVQLPDGTYTLDTATNTDAIDLADVGGEDYSRFFTGGSGTVTVDSGSTADPYATWAGGFTGLGDPDPELDFDGGGLATGIEWVVGGDPTDAADDGGVAPGFAVNADDFQLVFRRNQDAAGDPNDFQLVFRRNQDAAGDQNTTIAVEYGSDLAGWTTAVDGENGVAIVVDDGFYGPGIDRVTADIPRSLATGSGLFARLRVSVATTP